MYKQINQRVVFGCVKMLCNNLERRSSTRIIFRQKEIVRFDSYESSEYFENMFVYTLDTTEM